MPNNELRQYVNMLERERGTHEYGQMLFEIRDILRKDSEMLSIQARDQKARDYLDRFDSRRKAMEAEVDFLVYGLVFTALFFIIGILVGRL